MKKLLVSLMLMVVMIAIPGSAQASQPDNYGQCIEYVVHVLELNPSQLRPPVIQGGPTVIIYDKSGAEVRKIVGSQAYEFGLACDYQVDSQ